MNISINDYQNKNKTQNNLENNAQETIKQWRNVKGDLDDFLFYYEENKKLSEK